jgi:hypothetical protein
MCKKPPGTSKIKSLKTFVFPFGFTQWCHGAKANDKTFVFPFGFSS